MARAALENAANWFETGLMMTAGQMLRHSRTLAIRLALIAGLVLAAFAHRPATPTPSGMSLIELARYVLPDGSLPVLCLPGQDGAVSGAHCEFCLIAGGVLPPQPAAGPCVSTQTATLAMANAARAGPSICPACHATAPPRGPPARFA